jgi:syntaxin 5
VHTTAARSNRWSSWSSRYAARPSACAHARLTGNAQDSYIQSRSTAIESIESTIAELGQIFNQLAHMVAEQRETVQRIDADTIDIASNVGGAQRELLKYYASISNNRWLMLKVFGVLVVFVRCPLPFLVVGADPLARQFLIFILVS